MEAREEARDGRHAMTASPNGAEGGSLDTSDRLHRSVLRFLTPSGEDEDEGEWAKERTTLGSSMAAWPSTVTAEDPINP